MKALVPSIGSRIHRRPEREPVGADFPLLAQILQHGPDRVVLDLLHADVVQLQNVDAVRLQPRQRRVRRAPDGLRPEILRNFPLAAALVTVIEKIVTRGDRIEHPGDALRRLIGRDVHSDG